MTDPMVEHELQTEDRTSYRDAVRVKVSTKCLIVESGRGEYRTKFTFRKRTTRGVDGLGIDVQESKPSIKRSTCNLGHVHEQRGPDEINSYGGLSLTWEQAEQVMEWFATGTWQQVRRRRDEDG